MQAKDFDPKRIYNYDQKTKTYKIDISLEYYNDLYNEWDFSPAKNRDLDENLFKYLLACSKEIPLNTKLTMIFHLPRSIENEELEAKSNLGLKNFFRYSLQKSYAQKKHLLKNTFVYSLCGIVFLFFALILPEFILNNPFFQILPEGLSIGGWVLFWEAFYLIFFKYSNQRNDIKHYRRLLNSQISYVYETQRKYKEQG